MSTVPASAPSAVVRGPVSDPVEYRIERASSEAGERIFARTGIGDPYRAGIAYPVFLALLRAYPDALGGDTAQFARRFGFIARARDPASSDVDLREGLPVGFHLTVDPNTRIPFLVTNCTLCHAERVRWAGGERLVVGLGNRRVRVHDYDAAVFDLTRRADFTAERLGPVAAQEAREHGVAWPDEWRRVFLRATVDGLRERASARAPFLARVRGGPPGRVATIEAFAVALGHALGRTVQTTDVVGWARIPDVVGFPHRTTLSWDGAGEGPIDALVVEADFAFGVRPEWFWRHPLQGPSLSAFLRAPRERLPFPGPIDRSLAARGRALFNTHCARCHGEYGDDGRATAYEESVVPLRAIGTDPARALAVTDDYVRAANDPSLHGGLVRARRTLGYVPPVLTAVWTRGPYGHAGQWPDLATLRTRPDARPARFVVDLEGPLDLTQMGVPWRAPGAPLGVGEHLHDGSSPGLGVGGHPFLAELPDGDGRAVVEYLKTL